MMNLQIWSAPNGQLVCFVPETNYLYIVENWEVFFNATGTEFLSDFNVRVVTNPFGYSK